MAPAAALTKWTRCLAYHMATCRGLPSTLVTGGLGASYEALDEAAAGLLVRAQKAGAVRIDLDVRTLISMAGAASWLLEQDPDRNDRADFMLAALADGLRA
jgi:hypothetical protein